jgi:DNA polymerase II large subunit
MSLYNALQKAKSEEDVKDAYILILATLKLPMMYCVKSYTSSI